MDGLTHIFLHVALCSAIARLPEQTIVAMHVRMQFSHGDPPYDKTLRLERGDDPEEVVEFDIDRGTYHLTVDVPKYACRSSEYLTVLPAQDREVTATLTDVSQPIASPTLLVDGTAPMSFLYLKPTYVFFDKTVTCNQPIGQPLAARVDVDYGQEAYYASVYADPSLASMAPVFALRLRTVTGLAHYVRLPMTLPLEPLAWPARVEFNITDDMVDGLATDKTDTLLCPKIWETSAG